MCPDKMLSFIILVTILKCCHNINQALQKCFFFKRINKRAELMNMLLTFMISNYKKKYWFESVFSKCKENLHLMTYSNLVKLYFCKQN